MKTWLFLLLICTAPLLAQEAVKPDETAKFLAGMTVRDPSLQLFTRQKAWMDHATEFDKSWKELDARQLAKIRTWAPNALGKAYTEKVPLYYPFSGPDILYPQVFFPHASTYVLAGLEPVGSLPDVEHLPPAALSSALANLRKSLNSMLSFSFFITREMKVDLRQNQLSGTLPILYVFLARAGSTIDKVELLNLDKYGGITRTPTATPGVKISFTNAEGAAQTLYYFTTNLGNDGIRRDPGFMLFCETLGMGNGFVKAASYLPHEGEFTKVRNFLLTNCTTIVQDDSGIRIKDFDPKSWDLHYFGAYPGPIESFKQYLQPELTAAYAEKQTALPFGFGYRWHPRESSLIMATHK